MALPKKFDIKELESHVEKKWEALLPKIKATTQYDPSKPIFSFLEGPPTANAPPGLHHVEVRVYKDVYCRFKHMQGYTVPRKGGWDCHGLPVEVQVEKKLGLETKKDVINYGIDKFNEQCRNDIFTFIKDWEVMTKKLAYWVDLDNPYRTLDNTYIESVWWSLKEIHNKGLLYEGHKVVPYCPRCETPLSSHEVALGYQDVTEDSVYVKFQDKEQSNRFYLVWTTTPWTLPANMSLAVNPHLDYAVIKHGSVEYIVAAQQKHLVLDKFDGHHNPCFMTEEIKGSTLVGKKYLPLFDYYADKDGFVIVAEDYVNADDGTGIVHQAPAFGEIDYESTQRNALPYVNNVLANGTYDETVTDFTGMFVKKADPHIIAWLDTNDKLFETKRYTHSYPHCWRCSTPLLYYALVSWFIEVSKIRDRLEQLNKDIMWAPAHIKDGRFGNWLAGAKDWSLSRFKFWGTPLPVWKCACGSVHVVGSLKELDDLRVKDEFSEPLTLDTFDLHKSACDAITLKCPTCSGTMTRVPDVIDCWYDSGAAPFAQYHYPFENKDLVEKSLPYDFISEAIDQTRGWFYTLHVLGTILFDSVAYKRCYVGGLLCDENGDKMSKSKGNILQPFDLFNEFGVDAVRLNMCAYPLGENVRFGKTNLQQKIQPFMRILWNSYSYAHTYFLDHGYEQPPAPPQTLPTEDKWILSRTNTLIKTVENGLDSGDYARAVSALQEFTENDLSRTYIKLIRARTRENDVALASTFHRIFDVLFKLLAPFTPYLADALYEHHWPTQASVHFDAWPVAQASDTILEDSMSIIQELLSAANHAREKAKRGVRWPVAAAIVETDNPAVLSAVERCSDLFQDQANIKTISTAGHIEGAQLIVTINEARIRKDFKKDADHAVVHVQEQGVESLYAKIESGQDYTIGGVRVTLDHFTTEHHDPEHYISVPSKYGRVYLDTRVTADLEAEGYSREIARRIQDLRKKSSLTKDQRVIIHLNVPGPWVEPLEAYKQSLKEQVGASTLIISAEPCTLKIHQSETARIKDITITIGMVIEGIEKDFL